MKKYRIKEITYFDSFVFQAEYKKFGIWWDSGKRFAVKYDAENYIKEQIKKDNHKDIIKYHYIEPETITTNMYILTKISLNDHRSVELVSKKKTNIVTYLKSHGYYYSKKLNRYIDDRSSGIQGGSGTDYVIEEVYEIV